MKLLFASDSFKGTVTSAQTVEFLTKAANEVFGPCETKGVPVGMALAAEMLCSSAAAAESVNAPGSRSLMAAKEPLRLLSLRSRVKR